MKLKIVIIFLMVIITTNLSSQSIYSFHGPAEISYQRDAYGEGMGGTGVGDLFRRNASFINPAIATSVDRIQFATALSMGNTVYHNSDHQSFRDDQVFLPYFSMLFPYKNHRFGFNFYNVSSGKLDTQRRNEITYDDEIEHVTEVQRTDFTLFKGSILYANKNDIVNYGIGLSYVFGHNVRYHHQNFDNSNMLNSSFENEHVFKSPTLDVGLAKQFNSFSAGMSFTLPVELKGDSYFKTNTLNEYIKQEVYEYPAHMALGFTWKAHDYVYLSSDVDFDFWGNTNNFENSVNVLRTGLGVAWTGISSSRNFLSRMPLRAGVSYRNLPFEVNDKMVNEIAYHGGLSIPLKNYESSLMIAFKYFLRGDTDKHEYAENGFLLTIGTTGFDFIRRPVDRKSPRDIPVPDNRF